MIIFNRLGFVIFISSFGVALLIGQLVGISSDGPLMMIGGPLAAIADVIYRRTRSSPNWFDSKTGGNLFYAPVWLFGAVWTVLGILYTFNH